MKVMTIIDRPVIEKQLINVLKKFDCVNIIANYSNPYFGLDHVENAYVDAIFLNIEMSQLNGFDLAKYLKEKNPNVHLIFVTEHHEYAIEAFELNVLDYLTYPFNDKRLKNTLKRISPETSNARQRNDRYYICCFGNLSINKESENRPLYVRWRTRKTKEVFAYLLLNNGEKVRKDYLVDIIWPDFDSKNGINQLYSTIYQIRKTLKEIDVNIEIENLDRYYILHLNGIELDIDRWENSINELPEINEHTILAHTQVIYEYRGDIFRDSDYIWSKKDRDRLRETWLYHVEQVTDFLYEKRKFIQIINIYHHVQAVYPLGTNSYHILMKIYGYLNNHSAVLMQYNALKKMLDSELDMEPSDEIKNWYRQWSERNTKFLGTI